MSDTNSKSLSDLGLSAAVLLITAFICRQAKLDSAITQGLAGLALLAPAAIKAKIDVQKLDPRQEVAALERGEMGRPLGLVLAVFIGAVIILDSVSGFFAMSFALDSPRNGKTIIYLFVAAAAVGVFFVASHASHYLNDQPYLWTAVGIGGVVVVRLIILALFELLDIVPLDGVILGHLIYLAAALAGARHGLQSHDQFVAARLATARQKL